jgi:hemerythrin-like domain-containing protein
MNAFDLLKADHRKVAELFERLETASGKEKLDVFERIKDELEIHTHIEETILYPALEKPEETHDLTLEAYEEHKLVKQLLGELSGAKSATDKWQAKAKVLRENVEHHVDEEEDELFDKADDALTDEEIEALGDRMAAEKARKQGQPAPKESKPAEVGEKGIIAKIKDFVGLGDDTAKQKPVKKAAAKKKAAATKGSKKAPSRKEAAAKIGTKSASGSKSASKKQSAAKSGRKAKKAAKRT